MSGVQEPGCVHKIRYLLFYLRKTYLLIG